MIDTIIKKLFAENGLREIDEPVVPVSGGFMHRMYKVHACGRYYAVKHSGFVQIFINNNLGLIK